MATFDEPLFGCFDDWFSCSLAFTGNHPCLSAEVIREVTGESFLWPCLRHSLLCCIGGAFNRRIVREKYHIEGGFMRDCIYMWFCAPCATGQLWREKNRREMNS